MVETLGNVLKAKNCHFHSAFCVRKMSVLKLAEYLSAQTHKLRLKAVRVE